MLAVARGPRQLAPELLLDAARGSAAGQRVVEGEVGQALLGELPGRDVDRDPGHRAILEAVPGAVVGALGHPHAILERLAGERAARVVGHLRQVAVVEDRRPDHLARREAEALERLALGHGDDPVGIRGEQDHRRDVDDRRQARSRGVERHARLAQRRDVEADALRALVDDRHLALPDPEPAAVAPAHPVLDVEHLRAERGGDDALAIVGMDQRAPELRIVRPEVGRQAGPLRDLALM